MLRLSLEPARRGVRSSSSSTTLVRSRRLPIDCAVTRYYF